MIPWTILERIQTPEGTLELRKHGERDFLMTIAGRVLMTSQHHRSEDALAELACQALGRKGRARILLGGLGMGFSLRAALAQLPAAGQVVVVELNAKVVDWNRDILGALTHFPLHDKRVKVVVGDVARFIADTRPQSFDAIIFDLYEGPHGNRDRHPLYGERALAQTRAALADGGIFSVWSEERDMPFEERLKKHGFSVERHASGKGGRVHLVYLARAEDARLDRDPGRTKAGELQSREATAPARPRSGRGRLARRGG